MKNTEGIPDNLSEEREIAPETMERAREGRVKVLDGFISRLRSSIDAKMPKFAQRLVSSTIDATLVGNIKMTAQAITGKTAMGEKVSPKDRAIYGLIVGAADIAIPLAALGNYRMAAGSYAASWLLFVAHKGPDVTRDLGEVAVKYGVPAAGKFLERTSEIFSKIDPQEIRDWVGR